MQFSGRIVRFAVPVIVAMATSLAYAQVPASSLNGRVTDPKDAVLMGAQVTAVSEAQGVSRVTETNSSGLYALPNLQANMT